MSENKNGLDGLVGDEEKETEDHVVDVVHRIAKFTKATAASLHDSVKANNERVDSFREEIHKIEDRNSEKLDKMADVINERLSRMEKRGIATGKLALVESTDELLAAIPEHKRHMVQLAKQSMGDSKHPRTGEQITERGKMADPIFKAATGLWFQNSTKLQLQRFGRDHNRLRDELETLERGFADVYGKAISSFQGTADARGGYLVPTPVESEILRLIEDNGIMRPLVRKITMTSDTLNIPKKGNAITAYLTATESDTLTGSYDQTAFTQVQLVARRFHGRATASIEVLEDSIVGLMPWIQTTLAEEIAILEDTQALEGDGTGVNFTGVIADSAVNSYATTTTDGEAVTFTDLTGTIFKARQRSSRNAARWFAAPEVFGHIAGLTDGNGQPVVQYGRVPNSILPMILGFPFEAISTLDIAITRGSTGNTANAYFGPPSSIIFGDRAGMRWDVSDAPNWATYQLDMRLVKRTAIAVGVGEAFTKLVGISY